LCSKKEIWKRIPGKKKARENAAGEGGGRTAYKPADKKKSGKFQKKIETISKQEKRGKPAAQKEKERENFLKGIRKCMRAREQEIQKKLRLGIAVKEVQREKFGGKESTEGTYAGGFAPFREGWTHLKKILRALGM